MQSFKNTFLRNTSRRLHLCKAMSSSQTISHINYWYHVNFCKISGNSGIVHFAERNQAPSPYSMLQHIGRIATPKLLPTDRLRYLQTTLIMVRGGLVSEFMWGIESNFVKSQNYFILIWKIVILKKFQSKRTCTKIEWIRQCNFSKNSLRELTLYLATEDYSGYDVASFPFNVTKHYFQIKVKKVITGESIVKMMGWATQKLWVFNSYTHLKYP